MPTKLITSILCFLMGMTLLTFWLSAGALISHEQSRTMPLAPAEITAPEACDSAFWKLRCARDGAYSAPPEINIQSNRRSVRILRTASV